MKDNGLFRQGRGVEEATEVRESAEAETSSLKGSKTRAKKHSFVKANRNPAPLEKRTQHMQWEECF